MGDDEGVLLARIVIERRLTHDGDEINASFEDGEGETPPLVEILGMLAMTNDTAIRLAMGGDDE